MDLEMELLQWIGFTAVGVLVVGWLVVSFSSPGPRRTVIEWVSASAMYTALLTLFVHLVRNAHASDSTAGMVGFGFLCALFGSGLVVSVYQTITSTRGRGDSGTSATN